MEKKLENEKSASNVLLGFGYLLAFLGGPFGLIIALSIWRGSVIIGGKKYHAYNEESRRHGKIMFIITIVAFVVGNIIYLASISG